MSLKKSIRNILKEETSKQSKLKSMIKDIGIVNASNAVGGFDNLVRILNLDITDVDTQEMLVKNYIYFAYVEDIDVNFIEVKNRANRKLIKIYFGTDNNAANIESWYGRTITYDINDFFPFKVDVSWNPVNYPHAKIMIDAVIGGSVDFPDEINESEETSRTNKINSMIDKIGFINTAKMVGGYSNFKQIYGEELTKEKKVEFIKDTIKRYYTGDGVIDLFEFEIYISLSDDTDIRDIYQDGSYLSRTYKWDENGWDMEDFSEDYGQLINISEHKLDVLITSLIRKVK